MSDVLIQAIILTAANYLLVFYMTEPVMGPLDIFHKFRVRVGLTPVYETNIEDGNRKLLGYEDDNNFLAKLFNCHRCFAPWAAALLILLSLVTGFFFINGSIIIVWLAISGATIFLLEK